MKRSSYGRKRSVWIDAFFSVFIVLLTTTAVILLFQTESKKNASPPEGLKESPIVFQTSGSKFPGIKIHTEISNDKSIPYAVQYPQSIHTEFNQAIFTYIQKEKKEFTTHMNENKKLGIETAGELNISFDTLTHDSGIQSFVVITRKSTQQEARHKEIRTFHLDSHSGEMLSLKQLLDEDNDHLRKLAEKVQEKLLNDPKWTDTLIHSGVEQLSDPQWDTFTKFALTNEGLIIYFDENTVADGFPKVVLPLREINELLAKPYQLKQEIAKPSSEKTELAGSGNETVKEKDPSAEEPNQSSAKKIALTFDDGPDPKVTADILETLKKYEAKATFFMLGSRAEYYPDMALQVAEAGHELGNHSWTHPDLSKMRSASVRSEIEKTSSIIAEVTGKQATAFRPPYGAFNDAVKAQTDLPIVLWDIDTLDWKHRDPKALLQIVKEKAKPNSIILMHDIHSSTAAGLDSVLQFLQSEGYEFVTVSELGQ